MGVLNIDRLQEAAATDEQVADIAAWCRRVASVEPHRTNYLSLIERLGAAEELIAAQHKGLREWESECRLGMMGDEGEAALAKHTAYRERFPADE